MSDVAILVGGALLLFVLLTSRPKTTGNGYVMPDTSGGSDPYDTGEGP